MKKTIIAMLALSGVAFGTTGAEFNTEFQQYLVDNNYQAGDMFSISMSLSGIPETNAFVTLADSYYIVNESHAYWGLNTTPDNKMTIDRTPWTIEVVDNNYTYTSDQGVLAPLWTQNATGTASGTRTVGSALGLSVYTFGSDSYVSLSYGGTDIVDTFVLKGTAFDATKIAFNDNMTVADVSMYAIGTKPSTPAIPEPTTATLSLLALAGLAARRRRK